MENVKGMFSRKYGGVPAWLILLVAAGAAYLYFRHTGTGLFGGSSSTDPNATGSDIGSTTTDTGGTPSIVYVQQPPASGGTSNPNHPNHPAGPPATHKVTTAQRAAAIMRDFRKDPTGYFKNHPGALAWLKQNAPGDYRVVHTYQTTGKLPVRQPQPPRKGGGSGTVARKPTPKRTKVRG